MPCACAEFSRQITPGRREMLGGLFWAVFLSSRFFSHFFILFHHARLCFYLGTDSGGPRGFFPPPPLGLNINFSTIGSGGYFGRWQRHPAAFDAADPQGPCEVPGSGHGAAQGVGTPAAGGCFQDPGSPGRDGSVPAPCGWMSLWPHSSPCAGHGDRGWSPLLHPAPSPRCGVTVLQVQEGPGGMPTPTGHPSQQDTCPGGMLFPGLPVLGLCPPLWDPYPGENPSQGDAHGSRAPASPTFAMALLRPQPDPTHGRGAVCGAGGRSRPPWPWPQ